MTVAGCSAPKGPQLNDENIELGRKAILMTDQYLKGNMASYQSAAVVVSYADKIVDESDDNKENQIKFETAIVLLGNNLTLADDNKIKESRNEIAELIGEDKI